MRVWGTILFAWEAMKYMAALWRTLRHPVSRPIVVCRDPQRCRHRHRLAMMFRPGKPGYFVLVH